MNNSDSVLMIATIIMVVFISVISGMMIQSNQVYNKCLERNNQVPYILLHEVCKEISLK
jgi:hypothetical protein